MGDENVLPRYQGYDTGCCLSKTHKERMDPAGVGFRTRRSSKAGNGKPPSHSK